MSEIFKTVGQTETPAPEVFTGNGKAAPEQ